MDDFYSEMKENLDEINQSNLSNFKPQDSGILTHYFPNIFAEGLVPINPHRWPAFTAGSAFASDMPKLGDKIQTPIDNLVVTKEYLETSQSDIQWRAIFWQVAEDTISINVASELGGDLGSFGAGAASNKIAENYMNEMFDTAVNINQQEELNFEIFKQTAREQKMDVDKVRGTGVAREFVPEFMKGDICDRLERNARPDSWNNDGGGLTDDGIIIDPNPNPGSPSNDDGALNLPGESNFDSSSYSGEAILKTDENNGNIFGRLFSLFGFGSSGGDSCGCETGMLSSPYPSTSGDDGEKIREEGEKTLLGWFFEGGGGAPLITLRYF